MPTRRTATATTATDIRDLPHGQALLSVVPSWTGVDRTRQIGLAERDEVTWAQADERTKSIAAKLTRLRDALGAVTDLVDEALADIETAWAERYDRVLGYPTFEAYVADRFGDLGAVRLPDEERLRVVLAMLGTVDEPRMSGRGVGRVMAVDEGTVRNIQRETGRSANPRKARRPRPQAPARAVTLTVMDAVAAAGPSGLTIPEAIARVGRSYGSVSGALSALEEQGHAARESELRGAYRPYVAAAHLSE